MMIRFLEELSFNAWPALQTLHYDGWLVRFADGFTRRANSVNPVYASTLPAIEKLRACEQIYAQRGIPITFKLTEAVYPADLDSVLASEGYTIDAPTSVQRLTLTGGDAIPRGVEWTAQLTDEWLSDYFRLNGRDPRFKPVMRQMIQTIFPATCFMSLRDAGAVVALGLGVLERGYLGLYDIVVAASHRQRGLGTTLVSGLLAWGKTNGAQHSYLQVMQQNTPAWRLYARLGFREIYHYWYRIKTW
ncbi:MAG TPA: GNAT family N-acetyltransferase [Aggregatilineales bacterium]|nr:GNAT family N-acetyltransferase [Aggregatilineales bacterium]